MLRLKMEYFDARDTSEMPPISGGEFCACKEGRGSDQRVHGSEAMGEAMGSDEVDRFFGNGGFGMNDPIDVFRYESLDLEKFFR